MSDADFMELAEAVWRDLVGCWHKSHGDVLAVIAEWLRSVYKQGRVSPCVHDLTRDYLNSSTTDHP